MLDPDGRTQSMREYGRRLVGGGDAGASLREAAKMCPDDTAAEAANADPAHDVCVLPPSSSFLAVVVNVLAHTTTKPRQETTTRCRVPVIHLYRNMQGNQQLFRFLLVEKSVH